MSSLLDICEGLATNLHDITDVQWSAYMLLNPTPPYGEVYPGGDDSLVKYDGTFRRGHDNWLLTVRVMVPFTSDIGAQQRLYAFIDSSGPTSVKEALEADQKLGGLIDSLHVTECTGVRQYELRKPSAGNPGVIALGAEWRIKIMASGQ